MRTDNNKHVNTAANLPHKHLVFGFDRLAFWLDIATPELPLEELKLICNDLVILENTTVTHHLIWQSKIEIFQPSSECLMRLNEVINRSGYRVFIEAIEISMDFITATLAESKNVLKYFLNHMYVANIPKITLVQSYEDTYYFNRRANSNGKKIPFNFALYADKPSKLVSKWRGKPCCHLEYRLTGSNTVSSYGITSLTDCVMFDHMSFWVANIRLFKLPPKVMLGRYICNERKMSGTALTNQANKYLVGFYVGDHFVMQNLLQSDPQMINLMKTLPNNILIPLH